MNGDLEPIELETARRLYLDHKETECTEATVRNHRYHTDNFVEWCEENGIDNMNDLTGRHIEEPHPTLTQLPLYFHHVVFPFDSASVTINRGRGAMVWNTPRQSSFAVVATLMLLIAGCSGFPTETPEPNVRPSTQTERSTVSQTTTQPSEIPVQTQNVSLENASQSRLEKVNRSVQIFYGGLTREGVNPTSVAGTVAEESCNSLPRINKSLLVDPAKAQERGRILSHAAEVLNAHHGSVLLSPEKLRGMANSAQSLAKYTTLIGPWNAYRKASCRFDPDKPETVEDYYIAAGALVFELSMMQYQVYYGASFRVVNSASHTRAYRTIQTTFGDDVFGLAMSVSHWAARGSLESVPKFIRNRAISMNISINNSATNVSRIGDRFSSTLRGEWDKALQSYTQATRLVRECYKEATSNEDTGFLDQANDVVDSGVEYVRDAFNADYNVSELLAAEIGVDPDTLSDETMKSIKKCISENSN